MNIQFNPSNLTKSEIVKQVQTNLALLGYSCGDIDGIFGPRTFEAVKVFQSDNSISITGEINSETIVKLGLESLNRQEEL